MALEGYVSSSPREPRLTVEIVDNCGTRYPTEVVIDTGFTGSMALPPDIISNLRLVRTRPRRVSLADGNLLTVPTHAAIIIWHGSFRRIRVLELAGKPVLGMSLLWNSDIAIAVRENGRVSITAPTQ